MRFLSSIRIVRVALALAVALWMAGAGCMLGCENMVVAAAEESGSTVSATAENSLTIFASGNVCASMHSHDCCAKRRAKSGDKSAAKSPSPKSANQSQADSLEPVTGATLLSGLENSSSGMMDGCPLAVNATAAIAKARQDQSSDKASAIAPLPLQRFLEQSSALSPPPLLPNRGHTYLRCCVFLI